MIHIATIHWQTDKWIDIQKRYLDKFIKKEYRLYAFLNGIDQRRDSKFYFVSREPICEHYIKLNILANIIRFAAKNTDDLIFFLDGDAFPVGDIVKLVREKIQKHKLIAIQRIENNGDKQPHPAFCATTVGFWQEIEGDWSPGYTWENSIGQQITDVGGELLKKMEQFNVSWFPMHRTGQLHNDPLWFGIYENVLYHHNCGFRKGLGRIILKNEGIEKANNSLLARILNKLPEHKAKAKIHPGKKLKRKTQEKYQKIDNLVYNKIVHENPFP